MILEIMPKMMEVLLFHAIIVIPALTGIQSIWFFDMVYVFG